MPSGRFYVEAPNEWSGSGLSVFLAGGITNCPDWQRKASTCFMARNVTVLNPRRADFPMDDPSAAGEQIAWEFRHLHRASVVLFWFAGGPSDQPIALYELGRHAALGRPIAVGCDYDYRRRIDVIEQMKLARPHVPVLNSLESTCADALSLLVRA